MAGHAVAYDKRLSDNKYFLLNASVGTISKQISIIHHIIGSWAKACQTKVTSVGRRDAIAAGGVCVKTSFVTTRDDGYQLWWFTSITVTWLSMYHGVHQSSVLLLAPSLSDHVTFSIDSNRCCLVLQESCRRLFQNLQISCQSWSSGLNLLFIVVATTFLQ